jgi:small subunit ribosomal protein S6
VILRIIIHIPLAISTKIITFAGYKNIFSLTKFIFMNHYETVFILTPVLSDAQVKEAVDKFRGIITNGGGQIVHEEDWGLKKLAYPIQKKSTAFYSMMEFKAESQLIEKLETEFRRDERIIRFLTFRLDKDAVEYAIRRKNNLNSKKEAQ